MEKMTGLSRAQITRLITRYGEDGDVRVKRRRRHRFAPLYRSLMEEENPGEVGRGETDVAGVLVTAEGPEQLGEVDEGALQTLVLGAARRKRIDDVEGLSRGGAEDRDGLSRRRGSWHRGASGCRSRSGSGSGSVYRRGRRNRSRRGFRWGVRSVLGSSGSRCLGAVVRRVGGGRCLLGRLVLGGGGGARLGRDGLGGGAAPGRIARGRRGIAPHRLLLGGRPPGVDVPTAGRLCVAGTLVVLRFVVAGDTAPAGLLRRCPPVGLRDQLGGRRLDRLLGPELGSGVEAEAPVVPAQGLEDDVLALPGRTCRVEEVAEEEVQRGGVALALQGEGTRRTLCLHGLEQGCQARFLKRALSLHRTFSVWGEMC